MTRSICEIRNYGPVRLLSMDHCLSGINTGERFPSLVLVRHLSIDFVVLQMGPAKRQLSGFFLVSVLLPNNENLSGFTSECS